MFPISFSTLMFNEKLLGASSVSSSTTSSASIWATKALPNSALISSFVNSSTFSVKDAINSSPFSNLVENLVIISNFSFLVYLFNASRAALSSCVSDSFWASNSAIFKVYSFSLSQLFLQTQGFSPHSGHSFSSSLSSSLSSDSSSDSSSLSSSAANSVSSVGASSDETSSAGCSSVSIVVSSTTSTSVADSSSASTSASATSSTTTSQIRN